MTSILVVEDSKSFAKLLKFRLEATLGCEVTLAHNLAEAAVLVAEREESFFLAILDLHLPDAPKGEIVDMILSHNIPAIVLTGEYREDVRDQMLAKGVLDYFIKNNISVVDTVIHFIDRMHRNQHTQVLVVDDSRSFRSSLVNFLRRYHFQVFEAEDGVKALAMMAENDFRLVITDNEMPVMDGLQLTRKIRAKYSGEVVSVVGVSSNGTSDIAARFIKSGANDFLVKPFRNEELLCRVTQNVEFIEKHQELARLIQQERTLRIEEMKESLERLGAILQTAMDAIVITDQHGLVVDFNPAAEVLFGYRREEMQGVNFMATIAPEAMQETNFDGVCHHNTLEKHSNRRHEIKSRRKDGSLIDLEMAVTTVARGGNLFCTFFIHDITERKQLLKTLEETLTTAESANRAKSVFLANMSHEIRSPMHVVLGMVRFLGKTILTPQQHNYTEKIGLAANSLLQIINDILDFSKIEAGMLQLEAIPFRLDELIKNHANLVEFRAQEKGLTCRFQIQEGMPHGLLGDPLRITQVLNNLVYNAIKFTETGEVVLGVEMLQASPDSVFLRFSVTDSGIGMTPEQRDRLFQPFQQADMSTTRKFGGTGLGLAICKQLVEMMGGSIGVESEAGKGSTFAFTLTFPRQADHVSYVPTIPNEDTIKEKLAKIYGARILVVDDIKVNRELAKELLEEIGITVDLADDGRQAVHAIAESSLWPDAILMDLQMPEMDGIDATIQIRNIKGAENLPIIAMTADAMVSDRERCLFVGMNDHLAKPIDVMALYACLVRWIKPRQEGAFRKKPLSPPPVTVESDKFSLLVVHGDPQQEESLRNLLQDDYILLFTPDPTNIIDVVMSHLPDLILLNVNAPGVHGKELCVQLKHHEPTKEICIILLSAAWTQEEEAAWLLAGADDCIKTPLNTTLLKLKIQRQLAAKTVKEGLVCPAYVDQLTGIPNRLYLEPRLRTEWQRALRIQMPMALVLVEVDLFTEFKNANGTTASEECFKKIGRALLDLPRRPADLLCRSGDERFTFLLPGTTVDGAHAFAKFIWESVSALKIAHRQSQISPYVTLSVGGCSAVPRRNDTPNHFQEYATQLLAQAIEEGRNRVVVSPFLSTASETAEPGAVAAVELGSVDLPGVDVTAALVRLGGNKRLHLKLLLGLVRDFSDAGEQIRSNLKDMQDLETAQRMAHSIKGLAGNVAAQRLFEAAAALEKGIKEHQQESWPGLLDAFDHALKEVIGSIGKLQDNTPTALVKAVAPAAQKPLDVALVVPAMAELSQALLASSFKSKKLFVALKNLFEGSNIGEEMSQLENCISRFDYKGAQAALDALGKNLGVAIF